MMTITAHRPQKASSYLSSFERHDSQWTATKMMSHFAHIQPQFAMLDAQI